MSKIERKKVKVGSMETNKKDIEFGGHSGKLLSVDGKPATSITPSYEDNQNQGMNMTTLTSTTQPEPKTCIMAKLSGGQTFASLFSNYLQTKVSVVVSHKGGSYELDECETLSIIQSAISEFYKAVKATPTIKSSSVDLTIVRDQKLCTFSGHHPIEKKHALLTINASI